MKDRPLCIIENIEKVIDDPDDSDAVSIVVAALAGMVDYDDVSLTHQFNCQEDGCDVSCRLIEWFDEETLRSGSYIQPFSKEDEASLADQGCPSARYYLPEHHLTN